MDTHTDMTFVDILGIIIILCFVLTLVIDVSKFVLTHFGMSDKIVASAVLGKHRR